MDLEEELSLFQQQETESAQQEQQHQSDANGDKDSDDLLGLDQNIKLTSRSKIAKIDNERIFNKQKGLNYIIQNHTKLKRIFHKNDKALQKKLLSNKSSLSSKAVRQMKYENEYNNLSSILQFYQLWCHGLFPKAKFKDCIQLVRSFGAKSSQLKIYRRELIEKELRELKESKGIIDKTERPAESIDDQEQLDQLQGNTHPQEIPQSIDDDDWSFMNTNESNGLFVGDDDLYHTPSNLVSAETHKDEESISKLENEPIGSNQNDIANNADDSDDPFSDDDIPIEVNKQPEYPYPEMDTNDKEYEDEMEVMREMGL